MGLKCISIVKVYFIGFTDDAKFTRLVLQLLIGINAIALLFIYA